MKRLDTSLSGVAIIEPVVFGDARGYFFEAYNAAALARIGIEAHFVQDNQSFSRRGILRGLHFQLGKPQGKLIRCLSGAIFDVVVDIRRSSATFGQWTSVELSSDNRRMLWVPPGFAHGFVVVSEVAEVLYKVTDYWSRPDERGLRWNDSRIGIVWPHLGIPPELNPRDANWPDLAALAPEDLFP